MPMDDGPVTPALLLWTAMRVINQHAEPASPHRETGRCAQCGDGACGMLAWAIGEVKRQRMTGNRAARYGMTGTRR
ncbi:hypothetical protein ACTFTM_14120 [Micromonospora sp. RB23]